MEPLPIDQVSADERRRRVELAAVAYVMSDELPSLTDRIALVAAIRSGEVEDMYRPLGASTHNVTLPDVPPWVDPRVRVADWAAIARAGHDVRAVWVERHVDMGIQGA